MKVILFGATGMVGRGVLRECLLDPGVETVLAVGRAAPPERHDKLQVLLHQDFLDLSPIAGRLSGFGACLYCLGISSAGMTEADYRRITYDYAVEAARRVHGASPGATFVFVSGGGADSTERGRSMWARVKGQTENAILRMPLAGKYVFRPAFIQPRHGIVSRTRAYRVLYALLGPLYPVLRALFPRYVTTTEIVGRAMLEVARHGADKPLLENHDINEVAAQAGGGRPSHHGDSRASVRAGHDA